MDGEKSGSMLHRDDALLNIAVVVQTLFLCGGDSVPLSPERWFAKSNSTETQSRCSYDKEIAGIILDQRIIAVVGYLETTPIGG